LIMIYRNRKHTLRLIALLALGIIIAALQLVTLARVNYIIEAGQFDGWLHSDMIKAQRLEKKKARAFAREIQVELNIQKRRTAKDVN